MTADDKARERALSLCEAEFGEYASFHRDFEAQIAAALEAARAEALAGEVTLDMAKAALLGWCNVPPESVEAFWAGRKGSDALDGTFDAWKRAIEAAIRARKAEKPNAQE